MIRSDSARPAAKVHLLRVDPRTVKPGGADADEKTVVVLQAPLATPQAPVAPAPSASHRRGHPASPAASVSGQVAERHVSGETTLWYAGGVFVIADKPPVAGATALATGVAPSHPGVSLLSSVRAAVCVGEEDGMMNWAELPEPQAASAKDLLNAALDRAGCGGQRLIITGGTQALLGGALDLGGSAAVASGGGSTRLVRVAAPGAHPMFEDTTPLPYNVWGPIQSQRVKPASK